MVESSCHFLFHFHFEPDCIHIEILFINGNIFASYALFPRKLDTIATFPLSCNVTSNPPPASLTAPSTDSNFLYKCSL